MSVQSNSYVMWGVLIPYNALPKDDFGDQYSDAIDAYCDSAFKPDVNLKDDITVLFDGMNGDYVAVGHVTHKTKVYQGFSEPIKVGGRPKASWKAGLETALKSIAAPPLDQAPGWLVITHYR